MKHEFETFTLLIHFFNYINHQFHTKISHINSRNGDIFSLYFKLFIQIMVLNLFLHKFKNGFMKIELFTNVVVLQPLNKIALSNVSIDTYLMLLELYDFRQTCLFLYEQNAFLLLFPY